MGRWSCSTSSPAIQRDFASPPFGTSEYELAGAYRGTAVDVVELPLTKLPVPAQAEIVIEGEIPPESEETAIEGPFGEWPGYYTHQGAEAVVRIKRIYYRDNPILAGAARGGRFDRRANVDQRL